MMTEILFVMAPPSSRLAGMEEIGSKGVNGLVQCRFRTKYYERKDDDWVDYQCDNMVLGSDLCIFHDVKYLKEDKDNRYRHEENVRDELIEKILLSINQNEALHCIGYHLPDITIEETFTVPVYFSKCEFQGVADFSHFPNPGLEDMYKFSTIYSTDRVAGEKFLQDKLSEALNEAKFQGVANFLQASFSAEANFQYSIFKGKAIFDKSTFSAEANFEFAKFHQPALFWDSKFSAEANFSKAEFYELAHFFETKFFGNRSIFQGTRFFGKADFWISNFSSEADFRESKFSSEANFASAEFSEKASFEGVKFSSEAIFSTYSPTAPSGRFHREANFHSATFSKKADFDRVKFSEFSGEANFHSAEFLGRAYFHGAVFYRIADFTSAKFYSETDFSSGSDF
jgi:hypothetical protein